MRFRTTLVALHLFFVLGLALSPALRAQQDDPPLSQPLIERVPEMYRDKARDVRIPAEHQKLYLGMPEASIFSMVVRNIAQQPGGVAFLLAAVDRETESARRAALLGSVASAKATPAYLEQHPEAAKIFEQRAASEPNADAALQILRSLRRIRTSQLTAVLQQRMKMARAAGDQKGLETLSEEEGLHYKWFGEIAMPAIYRDAPPIFSVTAADKPIRVVAFGDFGTGQPSQIKTAAAIRAYAKEHPLDFGITMGDNFYPRGMDSPSDPRWKTQWEELYTPLGIKFYAGLGNHDYGQGGSPLSEILYTERSASWQMPARYYTFTAGAAQFFNIDTVDLSERQLRWLDEQLAQSQAAWKIVYGHYQIFSATRGDNDEEQDNLVEKLLPVLRKRGVQLYICGHDHNLQILKPIGGVNFVVAGGGGAGTYEFNQKDYDRNTFKDKTHGFAVIEVDAQRLTVRLVNADGKEVATLPLRSAPDATGDAGAPKLASPQARPAAHPSCGGCGAAAS